jgi:hypothetical protein
LSATVATCGECGKIKRLTSANHPTDKRKGKVCAACYQRLKIRVAACGECGKVKRLTAKHPREERKGRVCADCRGRFGK